MSSQDSYLDTASGPNSPTTKPSRMSTLTNSLEWRSSPLKITSKATPTFMDTSKMQMPKSAHARLSYHLQSPLFDIPRISPTFAINLQEAQAADSKRISTGRPRGLDHSEKPTLASSVPVTASGAFHSDDGTLLSARAKGAEPLTSRSMEAQNHMIDQQLEMLGELFPVEMKKYSQTVDTKALQAAMAAVEAAPPIPGIRNASSVEHESEGDNSSDFQQSPPPRHKSRVSQLLSDWPDLADLEDTEGEPGSAAALAKLETGTYAEQAAKSGDSSAPLEALGAPRRDSEGSDASPASSLTTRRSINPNLRVNTTNSQQYATKELQLIRKMKEEGRLKQEAKAVKSTPQAPLAGATVVKPPSKVAKGVPVKAQGDNQFRFSVTDSSEIDDRVASMLAEPKPRSNHRRVPSADSAMSGIVWSAVVEQFSEMAQEIAGRRSPAGQVPASGLKATAPKRSLLGRGTPEPVSDGSRNIHLAVDGMLDPELAQSVKSSGDLPPSVQTEYPRSTVTETLPTVVSPLSLKGASAPDSSLGDSLPPATLSEDAVYPEKPPDGLHAPVSIIKNSSSSGSYADNELSMSVPTGVAKVKRARTVRVQSHHANVEGDYADFLQKASGVPRTSGEPDSGSLKSGKSGRSARSARSGKSGIENGMYRRGSMRSILTRRTIATVGDVSIRDLSRGARFRHPNPFFSQQHGYRKVKAPHQAGPGALRRRGSKIVTLSVYEGKTVQQTQRRLSAELKRRSDDGETLGFALARLKDEKRKAPTMQIGDLTFETGAAIRPPTAKPPIPSRNPHRQNTAPSDLSSAGLYSKSSVGVSRSQKNELSATNLAYAASAFTPGTSAGSHIGSIKAHSALGGGSSIGGFPFPPVPNNLPPVPAVSLRGFAMPPNNPSQFSVGAGRLPIVASSNLSIGSASRAQMMAGPASNVSAGSVKSGVPPMKSQGASLKRSPHGTAIRRPTNPPPARPPNSMPMSMVENNFISMTPARSELSTHSARSGEKDQWDQLTAKAAAIGTHSYAAAPGGSHNFSATANSLPAGQLPSAPPVDYKGKGRMRSATDPLPPLPNEMPFQAMPASMQHHRTETAGQQSSRASAARASASLTIDTHAAEELARQRRKAKEREQQLAQHQQEAAQSQVSQSYDQTRVPPDSATSGKAPKSASSAFANVASVFTPKRPMRKDSAAELPPRVPRPPSAEPVDPSLEQFSNAHNYHRDSTMSSAAGSSMSGKPKGINRIFGFGRNKAK